MGVAAWREEVGRDISDGGHVGDDLNDLIDRRELGEEFGLGVALEDVGREGVSAVV